MFNRRGWSMKDSVTTDNYGFEKYSNMREFLRYNTTKNFGVAGKVKRKGRLGFVSVCLYVGSRRKAGEVS